MEMEEKRKGKEDCAPKDRQLKGLLMGTYKGVGKLRAGSEEMVFFLSFDSWGTFWCLYLR